MQPAVFNINEDRPQRVAGYRRSLVGSNHQRQLAAAAAPFFHGLIAPPDNQKALRLDCDFPALGHDRTVGEKR